MPRSCARPGCSAPATATFTFDGLRRIVWLGPLAEASAYSAGDLCRRHAELLKPPRHWELRDLRPVPGTVEPAGTPAPSRYAPPAVPPPAPAPTLPFDRSAVRPAASAPTRPAAGQPGSPLLGQPADHDALPSATSPLLSRAFRNAG